MTEKQRHPIVECELCPKHCRLAYLQRGDCRVRYNAGHGELHTLVYARACAIHVDPIEKKPMFHFLPGSKILSLATAGCNLHCKYCQNWEISQANPEDIESIEYQPNKIVADAKRFNCPSVAHTYTEPVIFYEYSFDAAVAAKQAGLFNIWVSAGYINEEPLREILPYIDGANIDLKGFTEEFYRNVTTASLKPVLRTLEMFVEAGKILEITNLVIPTLNDDMKTIRKMCKWIVSTLGPDVPLHFSRFYPMHLLRNLPPTPAKTLEQAAEIAYEEGLHFVYVGNIRSRKYEHTYCPNCKKPVIKRKGYRVLEYNIDSNSGTCKFCGSKIWGKWKP